MYFQATAKLHAGGFVVFQYYTLKHIPYTVIQAQRDTVISCKVTNHLAMHIRFDYVGVRVINLKF